MTRVIVLPFQLLRPDPEIDFLSHSLADAITNSLAALQSLVLRPTLTAGRLAADLRDFRSIAAEADVDLVVSGTLLRAGGQLRVTAQLISAAAETILWTHSAQTLALNPELSIADNYYAQLELDLGRAEEAMVRLIRRAASRSNDPDVFAALVSACRYCGLLQASIAAHERAHRLDSNVRTSVQHTHFMKGDYVRAAELSERRWEAGNMGGLALACAGHADAETIMRADVARYDKTALRPTAMSMLIEGNRALLRTVVDQFVATFPDPEAHFYNLLMLSRLDGWDRAIEILSGVVDRGFFPYETFARHAWLDPAREREDFRTVLHRAQQRHDRARAEYVRAGGESLLGPGVSSSRAIASA